MTKPGRPVEPQNVRMSIFVSAAAVLAAFGLDPGKAALAQALVEPGVLTTPGAIAAQRLATAGPGTPVATRPRPEYDPIGQRIGSFLLLPSLTAALSYDDNVLAQPTNGRGDGLIQLSPQLGFVSGWTRHQLNGLLTTRLDRFFDIESENVEAVDMRLAGRLDIGEADVLTLQPFFSRDGERRTDAEARNTGSRALFQDYGGDISYKADFNRFVSTSTLRLAKLDYETALDRDRDRENTTATQRFAYLFSPRLNVFLQTSYDIETYAVNGSGRNNDTWTNLVGSAFDINSIIVGELGIGVLRQSYNDTRVQDEVGLALNGRLVWNPTQLTSVIVGASRADNPTRLVLARPSGAQTGSARIDTLASAEIQHELRHDILLRAQYSFESNDYVGLGAGAQDSHTIGMTARYFATRSLFFDVAYNRTSRSALGNPAVPSTINLAGFDRNIVTLSTTLQF